MLLSADSIIAVPGVETLPESQRIVVLKKAEYGLPTNPKRPTVKLTFVSSRQRLISDQPDADALQLRLQFVPTSRDVSSHTDPITTQNHHTASGRGRRRRRISRARSPGSSRPGKRWLSSLLPALPRCSRAKPARGVPTDNRVLAIILIDR